MFDICLPFLDRCLEVYPVVVLPGGGMLFRDNGLLLVFFILRKPFNINISTSTSSGTILLDTYS